MTDSDDVVADIYAKIERERKLITGAMQMSKSTDNPGVQAQADNTIREARRNINYLETTLRDLQIRRMGQGVGNMSLGGGGPQSPSNQNGRPGQPAAGGYMSHQQPTGLRPAQASPYSPQSLGYGAGAGIPGHELPDYGDGNYSDTRNEKRGPPRAPFPPGAPGSSKAPARPNYSRLDLIKYDTTHLGPKIQLMLSQLEFKLSVEKQYKDGIEKIMGSYKIDGDKKIRKEAEGRRIESVQKIELLKRALKRYEDLHVDVDISAETADDDSLNAPSMRKPLTGLLTLRILAVSDVNHASNTSRFGSVKAPETFVIVKVEDEFKARTKATRTERWADELHEIDIDKGNEVELTVYDKAGDHPMPIGMLWIRISDIAEEIRRKRIETELQHSGWVPAANAMEDGRPGGGNMQFNPPPGGGIGGGGGGGTIGGPQYGSNAAQPQIGPVTIDTWFQLEPVGRIQLSMSFAKQTRERRHFDAGLNRKGAIRQRKEDVHELYGHKFIAQQFYNIMRCALCGELLKYATGMQCSDCKYMCHEKCYPLVVTKCITKSNAESDPDEAKLNHRIPHRFEAYGNIGANWCCHCGYILPLGRKSCKRCKECKLMCHTHCQHLVPDFCGMSMKDANKILKEIKDATSKQGMTKTLRPHPPRPKQQQTTSQTSNERPLPNKDRVSYTENGSEDQLHSNSQYQTPASARTPQGSLAAANEAYQMQQQQQQQQQSPYQQHQHQPRQAPQQPPQVPIKQAQQYDQKPPTVRSDSSSVAAAAAANALASTRSGQRSPTEPRLPRGDSYGPSSPDRRPQATMSSPYNPADYANVDQPYRVQAPVTSPPPAAQAPTAAQPVTQYQQEPQRPAQQTPQPVAQTKAATPAPSDAVQERRADPPANRGTGRRIGLDHFNFLAVLGKGNFGKVMLAETKATKKLYAIKVLKKEFIIENDEVESTRSERDVFIIANKARHPFLLNLHACFQTETRVYFVMEYISGGDLMLHIQRGHFGTKRAQFYAAEVCLALKYFHENGVVYRDLKLDNIMLTLDGHIKVADYGLCKKDMYYGSTTRTFCGTPEFMAPEILLDRPYGRAVDWWAFGVLIYQMLLQQSPFRGEDEDEIYDAILADEPLYPIHMPRDSVSILQKLLTREPELRLGSGPTDAQEIMSHAFFRNINWEDIASKRVPAPFLPSIKNATDTSNFDSEFTSVTPVLTPVQSVLSQAMQEEFRGFSYSADFV